MKLTLEPKSKVMTSTDASPPVAAVSSGDTLLSYFARQEAITATSHVSEQESSARFAIIQQYHKMFEHVASTCISRLEKVSELYQKISASVRHRSGHPDTVHGTQHAMDAAHYGGASPSATLKAASEMRRRNLNVDGTPSPPRILIVSRDESPPRSKPVMTSVSLSGVPQARRKNVIEKKLAQELEEKQKRLVEFAQMEERRGSATARRDGVILRRVLEVEERNLDCFVDSTKLVAKQFKESGPFRRQMSRKLDAIDEVNRRVKLEREAAAYAIRRMDFLAKNDVHNTEHEFEKEFARIQEEAARIHRTTQLRMNASETAVRTTLNNKRVSIADYQRIYKNSLQTALAQATRREHDHINATEKVVTTSVDVLLSPNLGQLFAGASLPPPRSTAAATPSSGSGRRGIRADQYAQFLGMRASMIRGGSHQDPVILSTVGGVAPASWK